MNTLNLRTIGGHLLFWTVYFLYIWLPEGSSNENYGGLFIYAVCNIPIAMMATYFTIFITVERFLLQKKRVQFWLSLVASMIIFGTLRRYVNYTYMFPMLWPDKIVHSLFYFPKMVIDAVQTHLIAGVGVMIYLIGKWKEQQRLAESLMKEKVAAELELLKSQVQPHFIFNTLNNIYMLSLKNSPLTSDMIYRLSALLSYMLYDSKQDTIEMGKEVDYIKNYINLEKIRYGERLDVQLNVYKNIRNVNVPPLLFLPLVENAFKHGVSKDADESWIHIDISMKHNSLIFKVENSFSAEKTQTNGFGNGLGLDNLKKRLEILYPNAFELKILKDECSFLAVLKLDLVENTEGVVFENKDKDWRVKNEKRQSDVAIMMKTMMPFVKI